MAFSQKSTTATMTAMKRASVGYVGTVRTVPVARITTTRKIDYAIVANREYEGVVEKW